MRQSLQAELADVDYASLVPFADPAAPLAQQGPRTGLLLRATFNQRASPQRLQALLGWMGLDAEDVLRYEDAQDGQLRVLRLNAPQGVGSRTLGAFALSGDIRSARWLQGVLMQGHPLSGSARLWLQARSTPPAGSAPLSPEVCSCLNVREDAIKACLVVVSGDEGLRLSALQSRLACGTRCGSCVPELRQLIRRTAASSDEASRQRLVQPQPS